MKRYFHALATLAVLLLALLSIAPTSAFAQNDQRCFPETGHCISGPIRTYWERNGGLAVFGYPITPLREETVDEWFGPTQWFERDRLEDHNGTVMAGRLGVEWLQLTGRAWQPGSETRSPDSTDICTPETGYCIGGKFRDTWASQGGINRFGLPITGEFKERLEDGSVYTVQYFERRRMELHCPNNDGSRCHVLYGRLGADVYRLGGPR